MDFWKQKEKKKLPQLNNNRILNFSCFLLYFLLCDNKQNIFWQNTRRQNDKDFSKWSDLSKTDLVWYFIG